jgi:hypothetical protein
MTCSLSQKERHALAREPPESLALWHQMASSSFLGSEMRNFQRAQVTLPFLICNSLSVSLRLNPPSSNVAPNPLDPFPTNGSSFNGFQVQELPCYLRFGNIGTRTLNVSVCRLTPMQR